MKNSISSCEMSNWFSKRFACSSSTPVKSLKPGDLDGGQSPEGKSESPESGTTKNGGRPSVLSRIFNCKSKAKGTKVNEIDFGSPAVSSTDGAHCNPN